MKMLEQLEKQKAEMARVKKEMKRCGTPHRNDLYKYYQKLKREYNEAVYWISKRNEGEK